ncbi:PREDICTED: ras-related protein RABH1a-like [Camelina sativa]|uniref:Ras-related protein RABH1a-like n=1 Tax=Camelina sativa TaxID=90675 RepID=A0ABM1RA58_CAMSA|nr:PREDICTED: ras-related protein RABH1a-like [Camelina sativa]
MYEKSRSQGTIGVDFMTKRERYEDWNFRLLMWDISGQERFQSMVPNFIRISPVALIVYDVSDKQTFINTSKSVAQVRAERGSNVVIVLVGNKTDLVDKRQVTTEEGDNKAREFGALFMETKMGSTFSLCSLRSDRLYIETR